MSADTPVPMAGPFADALAADGGTFEQPWQAEAFALTVGLHAAGVFSWPEWSQTLAVEIARLAERGQRRLFRLLAERPRDAAHGEGRRHALGVDRAGSGLARSLSEDAARAAGAP